jgi:hypothetical protein
MRAPLQARNDSDALETDTTKGVEQKRFFADNRSGASAHRTLAEMMNSSPRVLQQRALSEAAHKSSRMVAPREEKPALAGKALEPQGAGAMSAGLLPAQREEKTNNTGLPDHLKSGIESLSGMSMDHVKVRYNSDKPAQLQAHAFAQGNEIHLGAGQEKHLPHEAWHVVQQAQGRVRPTLQMKTGAIKDDPPIRTPVHGEAPVQRAVLMQNGDANSFAPTLKRLKNELILAAANDTERAKILEFLGRKTVIASLEVLRETDIGFNFNTVLAVFQARCNGLVNDQTTNTLVSALGTGTLAQAGLSVDDNAILRQNLRLSPYITTDDDRAAARQAEADANAIAGIKALFPRYVATFQHIFKGDFSVGSAKVPTGYHAENGGSTTHMTYGTTTALPHNTYQQSVRATLAGGTKKPYQSTFFPSTASEEDIKVAVVSGDKRQDKTVQYPRSLEGLPLKKTGVTIYPNTGEDRPAE